MPKTYDREALERLFAALTEHAFLADMGVADVELVQYVADLMSRFAHRDAIFAVRNGRGQPLDNLASILAEAERPEQRGEKRREIFRHAGDFALFWSGVFPEALQSGCGGLGPRLTMCQGKKSYLLASTYAETPTQAQQAPVLRRLSEEFEVCAKGLRKVRGYWEEKAA